MKLRILLFCVLTLLATSASAQGTYATIPTGTDLYQYFMENPVPMQQDMTWYDLEAGGTYSISYTLDFEGAKVGIRSSESNRPTVTLSEEGQLKSGNAFCVENVNFECAQSTKAFFQLSNTPGVEPDASLNNHYIITEPIAFTNCDIINVQSYLIYDGGAGGLKYCLKDVIFDRCLVKLASGEKMANSGSSIISMYNAGGFINDLTLQGSTFWNSTSNDANYFIRYNNAGRCDRAGFATNSVNIINCTFYNICKTTQMANYTGFRGKATSIFDIRKNIFVNCGNKQVARRFLGSTTSNSNILFDLNTYWYDGESNDGAGYDNGTILTTDPGFANAEAGDFTISGAQQLEYKTGAPRWGGKMSFIAQIEKDGIYYEIDSDSKTAAVLPSKSTVTDGNGRPLLYQQEVINIPATITYDNTQYTVNEIRNNAFASCFNLSDVTIPASVTKFGTGIFSNCTQLANVTLPEGMTEISDNMFYRCTNLKQIQLPSTVKSIGSDAFSQCSRLEDIIFSTDLQDIASFAFNSCSSLQSVNLPEGLKTIGNNAFYCRMLSQVTLPQSLETIGAEAFYNTIITQITIPANVTSIGLRAFYGLRQSFSVDAANTKYSSQDGILFDKDKTTLIQAPLLIEGTYTVPNTVKTIGESAFTYCTALEGIILPEGLTKIDDTAFMSTNSLTSVDFPQSLTYISESAFNYSGLTGAVSIPTGVVNDRWWYAFNRCENLKAINVAEGNPSASSDQGVVYNKEKTNLLVMPEGFEEAYSILPTTKTVGFYEFNSDMNYYDYGGAIWNCHALTSLHIPASVNIIVRESLRNNSALKAITVDESSQYFTSVDGVLFDKQKKSIYAFPEGREGSYQIPDGVETLTQRLFDYAMKLNHIDVPASVSRLANFVFNGLYQNSITWLNEEPLQYNTYVPSTAPEYSYERGIPASELNKVFSYMFAISPEDAEWMGVQAKDATILNVPDASVAAYKNDLRWSNIGFNIQGLSSAGIEEAKTATSMATPTQYFTLDGKRINKPQRGLNIVRMSDGTTKKVMMK